MKLKFINHYHKKYCIDTEFLHKFYDNEFYDNEYNDNDELEIYVKIWDKLFLSFKKTFKL